MDDLIQHYGSIAALLTAFFTGYSAYVIWDGRRQRVNAEWDREVSDGKIVVSCYIRNDTDSQLVGESITVRGPVLNVVPWDGKSLDKHTSWSANSAPASFKIESGEKGRFRFQIDPDPSGLRSGASSLSSRARMVALKFLWRMFKWRLPAGPKFSILLIARRRSSQMRTIRLTHIMSIYPQIAMQVAAKAESNSEKS